MGIYTSLQDDCQILKESEKFKIHPLKMLALWILDREEYYRSIDRIRSINLMREQVKLQRRSIIRRMPPVRPPRPEYGVENKYGNSVWYNSSKV